MDAIVIRDFFGGPHDDILMRMTVTQQVGFPCKVAFYDRRYAHSEHGQQISSYYMSDLMRAREGGINLAGDVPDWTINADRFKRLCAFLEGLDRLAAQEVAA